jgi:hypothetical protein
MSMTADVALLAAQSPAGYPCRFCHGMSTAPNALALATALPDTPPNITDATTVVESGPPRQRCINLVANERSSCPNLPPSVRLPAMMKNGSASIGKDCVC